MHRGLLRTALLLAAVAVLVLQVGDAGEAAPRTLGTRTTPRVQLVFKGPQIAFASDRDRYTKGTQGGYTLSEVQPIAVYGGDTTSCADMYRYDIYVATERITGGAHVRRVTTHSANDWQPSCSPDGARIAFCSFRDDPDGDIYTIKADGTDVQRLTDDTGVDWYPSWSPNGQRILWTRCSAGAAVWVMNANGGNKQNLTESQSGSPSSADWSPNSAHIVYESKRDGHRQIFRMKADGSTDPERLTYALAHDRRPAWSPDGNYIAFSRDLPGSIPGKDNAEIYVMKPDGTEVKRLTNEGKTDIEPTWSADSKTIYFASGREGGWDIFAIGVDGSKLRRVTKESDAYWKPTYPYTAWQPDYLGNP